LVETLVCMVRQSYLLQQQGGAGREGGCIDRVAVQMAIVCATLVTSKRATCTLSSLLVVGW